MPRFFRSFFGAEQKNADRVNRYQGFQGNGAVVLEDSRGTRKAEIPQAEKKGSGGSDPLAIYKPTGRQERRCRQGNGQTSPDGRTRRSTRIASEVANIQLRLYKVNGTDHEELDDHPLLTLLEGLLEGVNDRMTGIGLKYATVRHLELTGNAYWPLDA